MYMPIYLSFALISPTFALIFDTPSDVTVGEVYSCTWTVEDGDPRFINIALQNDED